ncbi:hypothetical protein [Paraburkholderia phosphatilytica]|uniref:hypothetical protein n=1 Tax=Paraburkholderia phosphatilytica TaxID=2282883 RepID=UPI000E552C8D|nr:hypothetical protein [Paraburkholderia phosphatilytica]
MSALMIKDLSVTEQLDSKAMQAVRGGYGYGFPIFPSNTFSINNSKTVNAEQLVNNALTVNNVSDNNDAFNEGLPTSIKSNVNGTNNVFA